MQTSLALSLSTMRGSRGATVQIQKLVSDWRDEWMFPQTDPNHVFRKQLSIPESLTVEDLGPNHVAVSSRGVNYYDAIKKNGEQRSVTNDLPDLQSVLDELSSV